LGDENPIVVIGAGSTGTSTAYHLALAKQKKVILIDVRQVGGGMTSLSSAIVRTHYSNREVARMALYSLQILRNFGSIGESGFVRSGLLILAPDQLRQGILSNVEMLNSIGAKNKILDASEAGKLFPELDLDRADLIVYEPESGYADSVGVANAYANAARELGTTIITGRQVVRLVLDSGRISAVMLSDSSKIRCSSVVLCTNVWTNSVLENSGVKMDDDSFPLWASAHPVIVLKRPMDYYGIRAIILDAAQKTYYKPEGQYLLFAGSLDSTINAKRVDPDRYPADVSFEYISLFSEALARRIPCMASATMHSSHVGLYDMTPDQHPIIDELSSLGLGGVYCCVGLSGHGFKLSPALGLMNAEMVLNSSLSDQNFDRSIFSLSRFGRGALLETKYTGLATVA
jgi:sarcosine oxidase, subunit beta